MTEDLGIERFEGDESPRAIAAKENIRFIMKNRWKDISEGDRTFCMDLLCGNLATISTKQFNRLHHLANPDHWAGSELERK